LEIFTMAAHAMAVVDREASGGLLRIDSFSRRGRVQDKKRNQRCECSPYER
jgi:hypothetical protein